jgi:hypothetical protein
MPHMARQRLLLHQLQTQHDHVKLETPKEIEEV